MCECLSKIKSEIKDKFNPEYVTVQSAFISFDDALKLRTTSTVTMKLPDKKKEKEIEMTHTHCPFCGEKYK